MLGRLITAQLFRGRGTRPPGSTQRGQARFATWASIGSALGRRHARPPGRRGSAQGGEAGSPLVPRRRSASERPCELLTIGVDELYERGLGDHPAAVGVRWPHLATPAWPDGETWCRTHACDPDVRRWRLRQSAPALVLFAAPGAEDEAGAAVRRCCAVCADEGTS